MTINIPVIVDYSDRYLPITAQYEGYLLLHDGLTAYYVTREGIAVGDDPFADKSILHLDTPVVSASLIVPFTDEVKLRLLLADYYSKLLATIYHLCEMLGVKYVL